MQYARKKLTHPGRMEKLRIRWLDFNIKSFD